MNPYSLDYRRKLELVSLKLKSSDLDDVIDRLKTKLKTRVNESREKLHLEKLELFKKQLTLNSNRMTKLFDLTNTAIWIKSEAQKETEKMELEKNRLMEELAAIKTRKERLESKLNKYSQQHQFLVRVIELMKNSIELSNVQEMIKRHRTLSLNWVEVKEENDEKLHKRIEIKARNELEKESMQDVWIKMNQRKEELASELKLVKENLIKHQRELDSNEEACKRRIIQEQMIRDSINYMFNILSKNSSHSGSQDLGKQLEFIQSRIKEIEYICKNQR